MGQGLLSLLQVRVEGEGLYFFCFITFVPEPASVAQLDALSDWRPGGRGFNPP